MSEKTSWDLDRNDEIDPTLVVIEPLGGGSRYEVFQAWDRLLFCRVAVKVVRPDRVNDERALEGFEREASIAARLPHPNLVRLLRWNPAMPRPYLVFEYVRHQTVADHLDDVGPVSAPEMCLLGIRMLGALHYMHSQFVLHLDVKPSNVTMGHPPRLLDFSVARSAPGPLKLAHSIGTAPYMAPEQCTAGYVTSATDLFSLGATLYEGVTGMQPFSEGDEDADDASRRYPQLVEDPQPLRDLSSVPQALNDVVMACLQREAERRPRSALEAAVALERVLEEFGLDELLAWPRGLKVITS